MLPSILIAIVFSFLLGSLPFGVWMVSIFKKGTLKALQEGGSGNIGATNVSRLYGFWPTGVLTFLFDFGKGALAVFLFSTKGLTNLSRLLPTLGLAEYLDHFYFSTSLPQFLPWVAGLAAVLGHCYNPWLRLNGGKGVATAFGVLLLLAPLPTFIGSVVFLYLFCLNKVVSLASLFALATIFIVYLSFYPIGKEIIPGLLLFFIVVQRHSTNIERLLDGSESQISKT